MIDCVTRQERINPCVPLDGQLGLAALQELIFNPQWHPVKVASETCAPAHTPALA